MTIDTERMIVLDILLEILEQKHYSHLVLRQALAKYGYLPQKDRAFIKRLSMGCVERLLELDAMIDSISSVKVKKQKPVVRNILRMAAYQLKYMEVPAHAVCDEAVKLAKAKGFSGLAGFVNGVCRNMARQIKAFNFSDREDIMYSIPSWLCEKIHSWYPKEAQEFFKACSFGDETGLYAHLHLSKASQKEILDSLKEQGVTVKSAPYAKLCYRLDGVERVEELKAFQMGWIQIQDISSCLLGQCVAPAKNSKCLDLCSAPGGKGVYLAEAMEGTGIVECRDISVEKLGLIEENKRRCNLTNISVSYGDASILQKEDKEQFDYVLADVPCSGLGVIKRKPDIKYQITREQLEELVLLQRAILTQAALCVKPGGVLIYSTCTINPEENEKNVRWLLAQGMFEMESLEPFIDANIEGADLSKGMIQLLLGRNSCDGFFIARLRKHRGGVCYRRNIWTNQTLNQ